MEKAYLHKNIQTEFIDSSLFERNAWNRQAYICGIDEVGRGCFFGPVVTAAVILHPHKTHPLLQDSKLLTEKKRLEVVPWIYKNAWVSIGYQTPYAIDTYNIYKATQKAMLQALHNLLTLAHTPTPEKILIDAMPLNTPLYQGSIVSLIKGENKSISIAAASLVAKVHRDALITRMASSFPLYTLHTHKGYGSKKHRDALAIYGASCMHRTSFLKNIPQKNILLYESNHDKQTTIC